MMKEIEEIALWALSNKSPHEIISPTTLPDPTFLWQGQRYVSFSTNNYLGLATSPRLIATARFGLEAFGVGNCESRLLGGDLQIYRDLEAKLAALKRKSGALVFATGYLTNLGVLSTLVKTSQFARLYGFSPSRNYAYTYFSDEFNHTSIREGIRMSGAERVTYAHLDLDHLESKLKTCVDREKIIVSDGVFSQDGDIAPLPQLLELAERYDATVYIDDAHATGVLGAHGGGTSEHFGVYHPRLIQMGTLSKAFGAIGGFIAAEAEIVETLRLTASAYGFTSTLPPDQALAATEAIEMSTEEPERRARLWENQRYFVARAEELGYHLLSKATPIVPLFIGAETECDRAARLLHRRCLHVDAIKFPAVPIGQSRLRCLMNADHTREHLDALLAALGELRGDLRLAPPKEIGRRRPAGCAQPSLELSELQSQILERMRQIARRDLDVTLDVDPSMSLWTDLGLDSLGLIVVAFALEDHYSVKLQQEDGAAPETVRDLLVLVEQRVLESREASCG